MSLITRTFVKVLPGSKAEPTLGSIWLDHQERAVSLRRVRLESGADAGLILPRGTVLKDGDIVESRDGQTARIKAAPEDLSLASCPDPLLLAKAAFVLGSRRVMAMVGPGTLAYPRDLGLDEMLKGLGLAIQHIRAPLHPENGAYEHIKAQAERSSLGD